MDTPLTLLQPVSATTIFMPYITSVLVGQERRHEVSIGEDGFIGTQTVQTNIPQKFSFSSAFGHFILRMLENAKFSYVLRKKAIEISLFLGDVLR